MSEDEQKAYDVIPVSSWDDLVQLVNTRYVNWAFRGHSDARWLLESTLGRRFRTAGIDPRAWPEQEERILRIFQRKAHLFIDHIPEENDSFRWLAMMQHHGAPTRLLDFTWSPYVAAFFALESATEACAAIWAVSPTALGGPVTVTLGKRKQKVDPWTLHPRRTGNYEKYFLRNKHAFVAYGEPVVMNQRLIAQSGTFLAPSTLVEPVDDILGRYPNPKEVLAKLVLSTSLREQAMLALYSMNITHYTLFPGLDGLARSMGYELEFSWWFSPRTLKPAPGYSPEYVQTRLKHWE